MNTKKVVSTKLKAMWKDSMKLGCLKRKTKTLLSNYVSVRS